VERSIRCGLIGSFLASTPAKPLTQASTRETAMGRGIAFVRRAREILWSLRGAVRRKN
jgi:hypothetical protein